MVDHRVKQVDHRVKRSQGPFGTIKQGKKSKVDHRVKRDLVVVVGLV